jgi:hypothetical protein
VGFIPFGPGGAGSALINPMTMAGDLIDAAAGGVPQRLGIGSAGQVLTAIAGAPAWASAPVSWLNVVQGYGADPSGVADSTAAIAAAVAAAVTFKVPVYFPAGTYLVSAALNWKINGLVVFGDGSNSTFIKQSAANTAILQLAGQYQQVTGLTVEYAAQQVAANTAANAIEFGDDTVGSCFQCWYHDLQILKANTGLAISPGVAVVAGMFSCLLQDIAIGFSSTRAISLIGSNSNGANCTGCVFTNIYTQNGGATTHDRVVFLENWDEVTFHQLNIEHVVCDTFDALALVFVGNAVLAGLHFEEVTLSGNGKGLINLSHAGKTVIYGQTARFCVFSGSGSSSVYHMGDTLNRLIVDGMLLDSSNTVTTPSFILVDGGSATSARAWLRGEDTTGITVLSANLGAGSYFDFGFSDFGAATFSGTGAQTAFVIAHGLGFTPSRFSVTPRTSAASGAQSVTADATNLTVTYTVAPVLGSGNVILGWQAQV